jgi:hypothetical protein
MLGLTGALAVALLAFVVDPVLAPKAVPVGSPRRLGGIRTFPTTDREEHF